MKLVVIGDGTVGKTCMIMCFAQDSFPTTYVPTVFDAHHGFSKFNGREIMLDVWDTAGQEDLKRLRPLCYPGSDIFLVCFSLVDKESFKSACSNWIEELQELGPSNCPRLLVGTKADLRAEFEADGKAGQCISTREGTKARDLCNFQGYIECSAKTGFNLSKVFYVAQKVHFGLKEMRDNGAPKLLRSNRTSIKAT